MTSFHIDYTERDAERRFKLLEGVKWNLDEARRMWCWVNCGMTPDEVDAMQPKIIVQS